MNGADWLFVAQTILGLFAVGLAARIELARRAHEREVKRWREWADFWRKTASHLATEKAIEQGKRHDRAVHARQAQIAQRKGRAA